MKTSAITATLPGQDLRRATAFCIEKVGLRTVNSHFLSESDGRLGLRVGDGANQLVIYPAEATSSGEFMQSRVLRTAQLRQSAEIVSRDADFPAGAQRFLDTLRGGDSPDERWGFLELKVEVQGARRSRE